MKSKIERTIAILLAVCFFVSLTAMAVSANGWLHEDNGEGNNYANEGQGNRFNNGIHGGDRVWEGLDGELMHHDIGKGNNGVNEGNGNIKNNGEHMGEEYRKGL